MDGLALPCTPNVRFMDRAEGQVPADVTQSKNKQGPPLNVAQTGDVVFFGELLEMSGKWMM